MVRAPRIVVLATLLGLAVAPVRAAARVWLHDGRQLEGQSVEKQDAFYLLQLESGVILPLPVELVDRVEPQSEAEVGTDEPLAQSDTLPPPVEPAPRTDLLTPEEQAMAKALRSNLAPLPAPVRLNQQMDAFGNPGARFVRGSAEPDWDPGKTNVYPERLDLNEFSPADWFNAPSSPDWELPESAYTWESDKTDARPSGWYLAPQRSGFAPTDGFRSSDER